MYEWESSMTCIPIEPDIDEETSEPETPWSDDDSREFLDYGRYFVPAREEQIAIICRLIPPYQGDGAFHVLALCCGEGLLAGAILDAFPTAIVHGYDGAPEMLAQARKNLADYGDRFETREFDLASAEWRRPPWRPHAVVSSLAIHHRDSAGKQGLFDDVYTMLRAGGVFIVADIVRPATQLGVEMAADAWDDAVRQRALEFDGTTDAFEHFQQEQWNHYRYPDPTDTPSRLFNQLKWLEQAGFADIDVYWMCAGHAIFGGQKPAE